MKALYLGSILLLPALAGCDGRDSQLLATAPTAIAPPPPSSPAPSRNIAQANWRGDATVLSQRGSGGCGWGTAVGEERHGVLWRVLLAGNAVALDEDMSNWPTDHISFAGTLSGLDFTARYYQGDDYARWQCQFREASIVGRFSPDFSTFEAVETLVWGVPGQETVVQRRWVASQM